MLALLQQSYLDSEPDLTPVVLILTHLLPVLTPALMLSLLRQRDALRAASGAGTSICKCGLTDVTGLICYSKSVSRLSVFT